MTIVVDLGRKATKQTNSHMYDMLVDVLVDTICIRNPVVVRVKVAYIVS